MVCVYLSCIFYICVCECIFPYSWRSFPALCLFFNRRVMKPGSNFDEIRWGPSILISYYYSCILLWMQYPFESELHFHSKWAVEHTSEILSIHELFVYLWDDLLLWRGTRSNFGNRKTKKCQVIKTNLVWHCFELCLRLVVKIRNNDDMKLQYLKASESASTSKQAVMLFAICIYMILCRWAWKSSKYRSFFFEFE